MQLHYCIISQHLLLLFFVSVDAGARRKNQTITDDGAAGKTGDKINITHSAGTQISTFIGPACFILLKLLIFLLLTAIIWLSSSYKTNLCYTDMFILDL